MKCAIRLFPYAALLLSFGLLTGCSGKGSSKNATVEGKAVTASGKPITGGILLFAPVSDKKKPVNFPLDGATGTFTASLPPGEYVVAVDNKQLQGAGGIGGIGGMKPPPGVDPYKDLGPEAKAKQQEMEAKRGKYVPLDPKATSVDTSTVTYTVEKGKTTDVVLTFPDGK